MRWLFDLSAIIPKGWQPQLREIRELPETPHPKGME